MDIDLEAWGQILPAEQQAEWMAAMITAIDRHLSHICKVLTGHVERDGRCSCKLAHHGESDLAEK
ncbi:MAG: hypothetical protein ACE5JU_12395 [Candidatus Binatia bacterium]